MFKHIIFMIFVHILVSLVTQGLLAEWTLEPNIMFVQAYSCSGGKCAYRQSIFI